MKKSLALMILGVIVAVAFPAFREKGSVEKAGEKIDKAVDDAKDKTKEAADKVQDKLKK